MEERPLTSIYNMVCEAPGGVGFSIGRMPETFDHDEMDNTLPHVHSFYEMIWFKNAGGMHSVDFQEYSIEKNTIFFLSPGQVHHFDNIDKHEGLLIKLCTDFMKDEVAHEDLFIKYSMFNAFDTKPYIKVGTRTAATLDRIVSMMQDELSHSKESGHLDMLRSLLKIFLITVHRDGTCIEDRPLIEAKPANRLFLEFRKVLEKNYRKKHTVKEYADMLNVSSKTLSNSISECSRMAPLSFINERIVLEARRLLRFSDLRIKEIADMLGYEDSSYFVKFFKRMTGYLPSDYREAEDTKKGYSVSCQE